MAKKCINVGEFKRRVVIETPTKTTDGMGGYTKTWATLFTCWAKIDPLRGYERMTALKMETQITHKITLRYDSRVTTGRRINYSSRIFNIVEVINIGEESRFLEVMAVEGAAT